jgi:hypothetical protein
LTIFRRIASISLFSTPITPTTNILWLFLSIKTFSLFTTDIPHLFPKYFLSLSPEISCFIQKISW